MKKPQLNNLRTLISGNTFFSRVSESSIKRLLENAQMQQFDINDVIFEKGDVGDAMYCIIEGSVKVHDSTHAYAQFHSGDCFGEYALIDSKPRSATVTAVEETHVLKIGTKPFMELLSNDADFLRGMLAAMIDRHRDLDEVQGELAKSKKELEVSNDRMKRLIEGAMDAIIAFDSNFRITLTNPAADQLFENEDVIGRNVLYFFDEPSATALEALVGTNQVGAPEQLNRILSNSLKVIGSNEGESLNEGTISSYSDDGRTFYILILRNLSDWLEAKDKISELTSQTEYLKYEIEKLAPKHGIIAKDESMLRVLDAIGQVAGTDASVLVTGETGTGKELVARAIHQGSKRSEKPLVRINCGAIPSNLIESELFGHQKGAFTGAISERKGRFLLADGGTVFLDEIGELPLELQPKLLRVLQEGEFDPVGSSETLKVDVRIIAATHRNLLKLSKEGKFREDLYYRLNVFPIEVPTLRDRGEDVCLLAEEMLSLYSQKLGKKQPKLNASHRQLLMRYHWPGNVRELQNLVERAVIVSIDGKTDWETLLSAPQDGKSIAHRDIKKVLTSKELLVLEKENMLRALRKTEWKISGPNGAAELLQLPPTTLASRMKALGIKRPI